MCVYWLIPGSRSLKLLESVALLVSSSQKQTSMGQHDEDSWAEDWAWMMPPLCLPLTVRQYFQDTYLVPAVVARWASAISTRVLQLGVSNMFCSNHLKFCGQVQPSHGWHYFMRFVNKNRNLPLATFTSTTLELLIFSVKPMEKLVCVSVCQNIRQTFVLFFSWPYMTFSSLLTATTVLRKKTFDVFKIKN